MLGDDGELIPPGAFLYIAERFGLIRDIDRWVVGEAIRLLAEQQRAGATSRLDGQPLRQVRRRPRAPRPHRARARGTRRRPARLCLRDHRDRGDREHRPRQRFAAALAELGCQFALDDFGAGFGSFYYLKHLPFDYLKIDGEFITRPADSRTDQLIVQAIVEIARGLGKKTSPSTSATSRPSSCSALRRRLRAGLPHRQTGPHHERQPDRPAALPQLAPAR